MPKYVHISASRGILSINVLVRRNCLPIFWEHLWKFRKDKIEEWVKSGEADARKKK